MKFNKKFRPFSAIKSFLDDESKIFLLEVLRKRKSYLLLNISSGIADAFLEFITMSMFYFIINILTSENKQVINWDNILFIKNFKFLVNFLDNIPFRNVFIISIIITLSIQIIQVFVQYINKISASFIEASYISLITKKIYSHIFKLSYKYSSKFKIGDLADYVNSSTQVVGNYIKYANQLSLNLLITLVYIYFLIKISFWNILVLIIIAIFSNKVRSKILPRIKILSSKVLEKRVNLSEDVVEKFQALRFIYSNGLNDLVINEMHQKTDAYEDSLKKISLKKPILPTLVKLSPIFLLALISIIYSVFDENNNLINTMAILLISLQRINTRFTTMAFSFSKLTELRPMLNRIILLIKDKDKDIKFRRLGGKIIHTPVKEINFSGVNFKYTKNSKFGLKDLNFSLKTGQVTAIVGLSGSGKSSILDLLVGLFEPKSGSILIDGNNLRDINLNKWQREISIVSQDIFLLNESIINNIKFGLGKVHFADIKKACIESGAHQFIKNLPDSYETIIGERGFKLSGGERQRLTIARAFLKKSSLLILDEATSALDSENEEFIKQNITKGRSNKITIIVAHRLSTIKDADNILVLNQGRIVERGNHKSLLKQNKIYTKLWSIQSKD